MTTLLKPSTILAAALALGAAPPPSPLAAQQPGFTIEQVMSAPFPDLLTAAPSGGAVAWVFNDRGARNIWVAGPPDYQGKAITNYPDDDGQEIGDLRWTPDAKAIVYVRGGEKNDRGEYPNPHSLAAGVEQAIWVVPLSGGAPRRVGEGHSPVVSPTGDRVAFIKSGQVWWVTLGDTAAATQAIHARGTAGSLRWSPDAGRLAFVSDRGDHALIGVFDVTAKVLRFVDPSTDSDGEPVWSPDGKQIAFMRVPAGVGSLPFTPQRAAQPWSIRVVDAATGVGRRGRCVHSADSPERFAIRGRFDGHERMDSCWPRSAGRNGRQRERKDLIIKRIQRPADERCPERVYRAAGQRVVPLQAD